MFYHYEGKTIIAWFSYRRDYKNKKGVNKVCYIYPRYIKVDGVYRSIKDENIEDNERIDMVIKKDGLVAANVWDEYGFLVTVKFRVEPYRAFGTSTVVNENDDDDAEADLSTDDEDDTPVNADGGFVVSSQVSVLYNPDHLNPHVEIRKFREWGFIHVLETSGSFEDLLQNRFIECTLHPYTEELDAVIGCGDSFYGPFKTRYEDNKLFLSGRKERGFLIGKYRREDVEPYCMPVNDAENMKQVTLLLDKSLQALQTAQQAETIDWITDAELVDELTRMFKKTNTSTQKKIISTVVEFASQLDVIDMDERRRERLRTILKRIENQQTYLDGLITYIYENPQQLNTLIDFVSAYRFDIFENKNHDIARLKTRLLELQTEIKSLNETKKTLKEQVAHFQAECTDISKTKTLLEKQIAARLAEFTDQSKALAHVIDYRLLQDIFHAGNEPYLGKSECWLAPNAVQADQKLQDTGPRFNDLDGGMLIDIVLNFMKTVPREIEYNDMVNYLVCITQGFITTFAGEPGTGKTSLCTLMAKSLGLGSRFVDISVERGWMSHKDFIGYYNPLTKNMEKSNNRVFDALLRLSGEIGDPALFLILLDEANLSPIEHYWAAFLRLCDFDSTSSRSLDLGGAESWIVPPQLRFLATVNFDHTTEELSPRFLDRSWIITLKSWNIAETLRSENPDSASSESDSMPLVSYTTLRRAFGAVHDGETLPRDINDKWNAIQYIFRYYRLPIAMRNQKMVHDYCKTACLYMDTKKPETRLAPLDYAVSQKILPIISGRGEQYRQLLLSLQKECETLPLCHEHIERMISAAKENMEYYQFFAK
ncbi:MAG: AAA family ATPase [Treponema sp.]|jgi:hypothetical protein|nr:AAA family ATPase [Treponema sp.]